MKKTEKCIAQEFKQQAEKRENRLATRINKARKEAFINGNTDEYNKCLGLPTNYVTAYNDSIIKNSFNGLDSITLDNARKRTLSEHEKINLTEELKAVNLDTLKVSDLKAICKTFGLATTGKKEELKTRINDYIYKHSDKAVKLIDDVFENIYKNGYFDNMVKMIIRKCGKSNTTIANTCNNIVFSGYNDALYDDIKQAIAESLFSMIKKGLVVWSSKKQSFIYKEIIKDENGTITGYGAFVLDTDTKKQTSFLNLFVATRKCIESYSKDSGHFENDITENNGFETSDLLTALESKESVLLFMEYLKKQDNKNYSAYCFIIQGIFEDRKQADIAEDLNVNVRKIKYLVSKLYDYAKTFFQCSGRVSIHNVEYLKIKSGGSVILKKDGNTYKESLTGKAININDSDKYHSTEKKGVIMYNVRYRVC